MRSVFTVLLFLSVPQCVAATTGSQVWDFESGASGWQGPSEGGKIAAEPGDANNHVYQIDATKPHHTQLVLRGSGATPDFAVSLRFRIASFEGEPPIVYLYGRRSDGFRALSIGRDRTNAMCYFGQSRPSRQLGSVRLRVDERWMQARLVCYQNRLAAKVWADGSPEPRWQIDGEGEGLDRGEFAVGVWTSPRTPSKARVLFDDIRFQPITTADLPSLGLHVTSRDPLDASKLSIRDGAFETPTELGLAAGDTLLAFDRHCGEVVHLVHKPSGQEFVSPRSNSPLFGLSLSKPFAGESTEISADDFQKIQVAPSGPGQLMLRFDGHPRLPITVQVTATAGDDGLVRLGLRVTNKSAWAIAKADFPQFTASDKLGSSADDDRLLAPWADGTVLEAPGARSQSRDAEYPGHAFTQFMAFYDRTAGVYLATHDPDGHCKRFGIRSVAGRSVEMPLAHLLPEVAKEDVALPYDVTLGTFVGDWRDAAAIYKRWAVKQPWCARTLVERDDIPQFLKEGAGVLIFGIGGPNGYNGKFGPSLDSLPEVTAAYRQQTGLAHVIAVPYGWENRGTWAGIHYLPAIPSNEAWRQTIATLHAQGDRVAMLTSGFWWVVKRQQTSNGPAFDDTDDFERRREMVVHKADGQPWFVDNYSTVNAFGNWRGLSATLCHGSSDARQTMLQVFLDVARLGTPLVSFDQEIGGGQKEPCYSRVHGHPPGHGNWMWTEFRDLCAEILRQGKPIQPELGLFMENCSELAIPYMATYWSRQFGEIDHGGLGARGVGLFSYLYHEYVTAIGAACVQGQGENGTQPSAELRCHVLANNLTRGLIPGPFSNDVPLKTDDAWRRTVLQAFRSFCRPYARFPEYLLLGTTCRPPEVQCDSHEVWFYRADASGKRLQRHGPAVSKVTISLPTVTAGSFAANDGSTGTVVVNTTAVPQQATIRLVVARPGVVLYQADRSVEKRFDGPVAEVVVTLEPFGTRMIVAP